jgi:histidine triad (HIT) family protein
MGDCVFCEIIAGREAGSFVYRDDRAVGFMSIGPVNPGHVMLVPVEHAPYMEDLDEGTGMHLFRVAMRMAAAIRKSGVRCEGINLFLADGKAAFQEVFHFHLHVFPRFAGDPFKIKTDWSVKPLRKELDQVARQIRGVYESLWGSAD